MTVRPLPLFVVALTALATSCADPAPLSRVHVTITNLHDTLGMRVHDSDSATIDVIFTGAGGDAGGTVRRAIFWDLSDTFEFDVQIPAGTYGPPRFEGRSYVICGAGPIERIIVSGSAASPFMVSATGARTNAPMMAATFVDQACP